MVLSDTTAKPARETKTYPTVRRFKLPLVRTLIGSYEITPTCVFPVDSSMIHDKGTLWADLRAPWTFPKHDICFDLVPIESNERLLQLMPLDRPHRLVDTTRTTPAVLRNRGHPLASPRC